MTRLARWLLPVVLLSAVLLLGATTERHTLIREDLGLINPMDPDVGGSGSTLNSARLIAALASIGANTRTMLLTPGAWAISTNVTVPSNVTFMRAPNATVVFSANAILTLNGPLLDDFRPNLVGAVPEWVSGTGTLVINGYTNLRIHNATVLTADLPAAVSAMNGTILAEDRGADGVVLVLYIAGLRKHMWSSIWTAD